MKWVSLLALICAVVFYANCANGGFGFKKENPLLFSGTKVDTFTDRAFDGVIEQINSQGEFTPRNVQSRNERNHLVFGVNSPADG